MQVPTYFLDILLTSNRFICRKGKPNSTIKIIKFRSIRDLRAEMFSDEFHEHIKANHAKRNDSEKTQPVVQHIERGNDTIMEMTITQCGRYLLLSVQKPWLELYDLTKVP